MSNTTALAATALVFGFAALFAWAGWYHLVKTDALCDKIAREGWSKFLAKAYSGRIARFSFKIVGVVCLLASLLILWIGIRRLLGL
jgi:hypothetical protein